MVELTLRSIEKRLSVRSFGSTPLKAAHVTVIKNAFVECVPGPFGGMPRFSLVPATEAGFEFEGAGHDAVKIGTYGFIRGAPAFILGAVSKAPFANIDFGYCLEGIILRAAELGLGTCWLGGALKRGQVAHILELGENEIIPCITPLGTPSEKRSIMDRLVRTGARGDNRKDHVELFFSGNFDHPFVAEDLWAEVLEAVRLGPSASNKQPWRFLRLGSVEAPQFHLYMDEDKVYNSALGEAKMQDVDMGIAMRHFEVASRALGLPGSWRRLESPPVEAKAPLRYIATWTSGGKD